MMFVRDPGMVQYLSLYRSSLCLRPPLTTARLLDWITDAFAAKWKKFSSDGLDHMLVIADFDFTLTTSFKPSGGFVCSIHIHWSPVLQYTGRLKVLYTI